MLEASTCACARQVFDPSCVFGHSELDLALGDLFGGFSPAFHEAYHALLPK